MSTDGERSRFAEANEKFWATADVTHFEWQTSESYFAATERHLLDAVTMRAQDVVLETGCGEGGNLVNMLAARGTRPRLIVGADLFVEKLAFARRVVPGAALVGGDAMRLPFQEGSFDVVLCRDVLHHLEDPGAAVRELRRVCKPGGRVWIIEPNGRNPMIALFGLVMPHERQSLRNSPVWLAELIGRTFPDIAVSLHQPLPIERALLHYRFGAPSLGTRPWFAAAMRGWNRVVGFAMPRRFWAYVVLSATRPVEEGRRHLADD